MVDKEMEAVASKLASQAGFSQSFLPNGLFHDVPQDKLDSESHHQQNFQLCFLAPSPCSTRIFPI